MKFTSVILAAMLTLTACQTKTATTAVTLPNVSLLSSDVNAIATGLVPVVAAIKAIPGIDPKTVIQVETYLATIQTDSADIAKAIPSAPTSSTTVEITNAISAIATIAEAIPAVAPYAIVINAALTLVPEILNLAGIHLAAAMHPMLAEAAPMSDDQARAILKLVSHQ